MKEYKYTINGNKYNVTIGDIEENIAHVEVNGTPYTVEMEKAPAAPKKVVRPVVAAAPAAAAAPEPAKVSRPAGGGRRCHLLAARLVEPFAAVLDGGPFYAGSLAGQFLAGTHQQQRHSAHRRRRVQLLGRVWCAALYHREGFRLYVEHYPH